MCGLSGFPQDHHKQDFVWLWVQWQGRGGSPWPGSHCLHTGFRKLLFVVLWSLESKASSAPLCAPPPGDQPWRGTPRAERLPQETRLRPGHLWGLPGGRLPCPCLRPWGRRPWLTQLLPRPTGLPQVLRVRVHGAGLPVPSRGLLPLRPHTEGPDRAAAAGTHWQAHLCSR